MRSTKWEIQNAIKGCFNLTAVSINNQEMPSSVVCGCVAVTGLNTRVIHSNVRVSLDQPVLLVVH